MNDWGKWLIVVGVVLVLVGLLAQTGALSWFGRLPGDIRVERPGGSFYFPVVSMLVVSAVLSLLAQLIHRLF